MSGKNPTPDQDDSRRRAVLETLWHLAKNGNAEAKAALKEMREDNKDG